MPSAFVRVQSQTPLSRRRCLGEKQLRMPISKNGRFDARNRDCWTSFEAKAIELESPCVAPPFSEVAIEGRHFPDMARSNSGQQIGPPVLNTGEDWPTCRRDMLGFYVIKQS